MALDTFPAAREERLKVSGNLSRYDDDLDVFIEEQALLRRLIEKSRLPSFPLDISDDNVPGAAERVAD